MSNDDEKILEIVKNMRKESELRVQKSNTIGNEIFIPTRDGKIRALIYEAKNKKAMAPVFFDVHGGGFVMGLPEDDDNFCNVVRDELDITVI